MGGDMSVNEAMNQALKLEAAKAATGPTAKLREVTRVPMGTLPLRAERRRDGRQVCC